jgi:hypothetical protein
VLITPPPKMSLSDTHPGGGGDNGAVRRLQFTEDGDVREGLSPDAPDERTDPSHTHTNTSTNPNVDACADHVPVAVAEGNLDHPSPFVSSTSIDADRQTTSEQPPPASTATNEPSRHTTTTQLIDNNTINNINNLDHRDTINDAGTHSSTIVEPHAAQTNDIIHTPTVHVDGSDDHEEQRFLVSPLGRLPTNAAESSESSAGLDETSVDRAGSTPGKRQRHADSRCDPIAAAATSNLIITRATRPSAMSATNPPRHNPCGPPPSAEGPTPGTDEMPTSSVPPRRLPATGDAEHPLQTPETNASDHNNGDDGDDNHEDHRFLVSPLGRRPTNTAESSESSAGLDDTNTDRAGSTPGKRQRRADIRTDTAATAPPDAPQAPTTATAIEAVAVSAGAPLPAATASDALQAPITTTAIEAAAVSVDAPPSPRSYPPETPPHSATSTLPPTVPLPPGCNVVSALWRQRGNSDWTREICFLSSSQLRWSSGERNSLTGGNDNCDIEYVVEGPYLGPLARCPQCNDHTDADGDCLGACGFRRFPRPPPPERRRRARTGSRTDASNTNVPEPSSSTHQEPSPRQDAVTCVSRGTNAHLSRLIQPLPLTDASSAALQLPSEVNPEQSHAPATLNTTQASQVILEGTPEQQATPEPEATQPQTSNPTVLATEREPSCVANGDTCTWHPEFGVIRIDDPRIHNDSPAASSQHSSDVSSLDDGTPRCPFCLCALGTATRSCANGHQSHSECWARWISEDLNCGCPVCRDGSTHNVGGSTGTDVAFGPSAAQQLLDNERPPSRSTTTASAPLTYSWCFVPAIAASRDVPHPAIDITRSRFTPGLFNRVVDLLGLSYNGRSLPWTTACGAPYLPAAVQENVFAPIMGDPATQQFFLEATRIAVALSHGETSPPHLDGPRPTNANPRDEHNGHHTAAPSRPLARRGPHSHARTPEQLHHRSRTQPTAQIPSHPPPSSGRPNTRTLDWAALFHEVRGPSPPASALVPPAAPITPPALLTTPSALNTIPAPTGPSAFLPPPPPPAQPASATSATTTTTTATAPPTLLEPPPATPPRSLAIPCPVITSTSTDRLFDVVIASSGATSHRRGASAIHIRSFQGRHTVETHVRAHPHATSVIADAVAVAGAISYGTRIAPRTCAILVPNQNVMNHLCGTGRTTDEHLRSIISDCRARLSQTPSISLHRVARSDVSDACDTARSRATQQQNAGDPSLFPAIPTSPATVATQQQPQPQSGPNHLTIEGFDTFEAFLSLPQPTQRTIPRHDWHKLARVATQQLTSALSPDRAIASDALRRFLCVPARILRCYSRPVGTPLPAPAPTRNDALVADDLDPSVIRRCERLARDGLISRAAASLAPGRVADMSDPRVQSVAQDKFPERKEDVPILPDIEPPTITADDVRTALRNMTNGSASAFSGWTKELLRAAATADESIYTQYAQVCSRLLAGFYDDLTTKCILASRFVGLEKPGKAPHEDLRPVCVGDLLYKITGSCCCALSDLPLPDWQLGCGASRGVHRALRQIRTHLDSGDYVLTLDVANAHNEIKRSRIALDLVALGPRAHALLSFFQFAYKGENEVVALSSSGHWRIRMNEGTRQGCTSAAKYFCHTFGKAVTAAAAETRIVAIQDDLTTMGPNGHQLLSFADRVANSLAEVGLELNWSKCELLRAGQIPRDVAAHAAALGIAAIDLTSPLAFAKILGSPFGDAVMIRQFLSKKIADTGTSLRYLRYLHPQLAYTLLRECHAQRWNFVASTTPNIEHESADFDSLINSALCSIIDSRVAQPWLESIAGAGLYRYASLGDILREENNTLCSAIETGSPRPSQTARERHETTLREQFPELRSAEAISQCGNHATLWMKWSRFPSSRLTASEFVDALRIRCHTSLLQSGVACFCGRPLDTTHASNKHLLACDRVNGTTWTHRHARVCSSIGRALSGIGCHFISEPTFYEYSDRSQRRPDMTCYLAGRTVAIDVSIVTPSAIAGAAAEEAAQDKIDKHSMAVEDHGHVFMPIIFESSGHTHPTVDAFYRLIHASAPAWQADDVVDELRRAISSAVAGGGAAIVRHSVERLRRIRSADFGAPVSF